MQLMAPADMFINAPATMIVPGSKYLLGILNSKIADYFIRNLGVTRNGGYFEYKPMFVSQMPVPIIAPDKMERIEFMVAEILKIKKGIFVIENELNDFIYELYQLTENEKKFINTLIPA